MQLTGSQDGGSVYTESDQEVQNGCEDVICHLMECFQCELIAAVS
jgi:hypothetical protein